MLKINILKTRIGLNYKIILVLLFFSAKSFGQNCTVNAGGNTIVCGDSTSLFGTISGNSIPGTINWTFVSGPGSIPSILNPTSLTTAISGMSMDGVYTFQLSSNCGSGVSVDLVSVTAHPIPPSFSAGPDVTGICATVGTAPLNGTIPAGYSGSWSAFNVFYWNRFGAEVGTNALISNSTISNPDLSLIQTNDHTIDPAYYGVLEITSGDGVCTYSDTTLIEFCPNPAIIPPASYTVCGLGDIYFYLESNSPMLASNPSYSGAGSNPAIIYTINEISTPVGAGTLILNEIEGAYVDMSGFSVEGTYVFTITVESPCCGGPVTTPPITLNVNQAAPLNLDFNPGGLHPEQLSLYSWGNSAGEVHCGIGGITTPELFYFDINAADPPSTITLVNFTGVLPNGASTPIVVESGAGTMNRVVSVDPGPSGWKIGTYEFRITVGTSPCESVASYFIHIADGNRPKIEVRDTSLCYPGSGAMSVVINQPDVFQEVIDPTYLQQFSGSWSYAVVSKPAGSGYPIFAGVADRELVDPTTTISNLTLPGDYVFTIKPFNGNGVGQFLQAEYACSGFGMPLVDTFVIHVENKINANAGSDQSLGCTSSIFLLGNSPGTGIGLWSSISSPGGATPVIQTPNEPNTVPTQLTAAGAYTFNWSITSKYGACVSNDDITFTISAVSPNQPDFVDPTDVTQPSCTVPTGSVLLNNLPSTGTWNIVASPGGLNVSGTGTSVLFPNLGTGDYTFVLSDGICNSLASDTLHILAQPPTPTPPVTNNLTFCLNELTSNLTATADLNCSLNWYGMNASGGTANSSGPIPPTNTAGIDTFYVSQSNLEGCESSRALLIVTVNDALAPSGNAIQSFCEIDNPTVADLLVTGNSVIWYAESTLSTVLQTSDLLIDAEHYYATQTSNGCESSTFLDVLVNVSNPTAPSGYQFPVFCARDSAFISDLTISGSNLNWYDASTNGNLLSNTLLLTNGTHYFATQTVNGCESTSFLDVLVTIDDPSGPSGNANQSFCFGDSALVSDLSVVGSNIQWYASPDITSPLLGDELLVDWTHYYATQTINGCESIELFDVLVTINNPAAPLGNQFPIFCSAEEATIEDLNLNGVNVQWYLAATAQSNLNTSTVLEDGVHYYATQTINNCESVDFLDVLVSIVQTPTQPIVSEDTSYCFKDELVPINAIAENNGILIWYSDSGLSDSIGSGNSLMPLETLGETVYFVNEKNGFCEGPSNSVRIMIQECSFVIPTAFTPDSDQMNDTWELDGIDQLYDKNVVRIYNRWGTLLFTSPEGNYEQNSWNGKFKGEELPVASYYFIIDFNDGNRKAETGTVTIIKNN